MQGQSTCFDPQTDARIFYRSDDMNKFILRRKENATVGLIVNSRQQQTDPPLIGNFRRPN